MTTPAHRELYTGAIANAISSVPESVRNDFVREILSARQIVVAGRGRSGMMAAAFARRLGQMGLAAWGLDDSTVPRLGKRDVLVACTGSGTTPTVLSLMETARLGGARVLSVTRQSNPIAVRADVVAELDVEVPKSDGLFPLGTLFEVSLLAFLDHIVVDLIAALGATESDLGARHTNLE